MPAKTIGGKLAEASPEAIYIGRWSGPSAPDIDGAGIVQVKVWQLGIDPMAWRRVLVPSTCTLGELHGVIQVAMRWEGIERYQFCLRAARFRSRAGLRPSLTSAGALACAVSDRDGGMTGSQSNNGMRTSQGLMLA